MLKPPTHAKRLLAQLLLALLMTVVPVLLVACGSSDDLDNARNGVVGTWDCGSGSGVTYTSDGTFRQWYGQGDELDGNYTVVMWTFGGDSNSTYPIVTKVYIHWQWSAQNIALFNKSDSMLGDPIGTLANKTPSVDRAEAVVSLDDNHAVFSQLDDGGRADPTPGLDLDPTRYAYVSTYNQTCHK